MDNSKLLVQNFYQKKFDWILDNLQKKSALSDFRSWRIPIEGATVPSCNVLTFFEKYRGNSLKD